MRGLAARLSRGRKPAPTGRPEPGYDEATGPDALVLICVRDEPTRATAPSLARALAPGGGLNGGVRTRVAVVDARPAPSPGAGPAGGDDATPPPWPPGVAVVAAPGADAGPAWQAGIAHLGAAAVLVLVDGPVVAGRSTPFLAPLVAAVHAGATLAQPVPQAVADGPATEAWSPTWPAGEVLAIRGADAHVVATATDATDLCRRLLADPAARTVLVDASTRTTPRPPPPATGPPAGPPATATGAGATRHRPGPAVLGPSGSPGRAPRRWAIRTSVGFGPRRDLWGDLHFARGLASALGRHGEHAVVDYRDSVNRASATGDDVVLLIRGPHRIDPPDRQPRPASLLWVISHPDDVTADECAGYDEVWSAGSTWARQAEQRRGRAVEVLLQCTDADRFDPRRGSPGTGPDVLFVGSARDGMRPIVGAALAAGLAVTVYGQGWERHEQPLLHHAGTYLPNEELAAAYRGAGVVLNDHWPDMRRGGFLSNRLFDAAASGARVVTDAVADDAVLHATFHGLVRSTSTVDELAALVADRERSWPDDEARATLADLVRAEHGFDARARVLLDAASRLG